MATTTERRLAAQIAAHESWARTPDRRARTAAATRASAAAARDRALTRYETEIDPDHQLDSAERRRRAESHYNAATARARLKQARARHLADEAARLHAEADADITEGGF